jgi:hypothetical protein
MMKAVRTSETSVDNHYTRQYNPEDSFEHRPQTCLTKHGIVTQECIVTVFKVLTALNV